MADQAKDEKNPKNKNYKIKIPEAVEEGVYANAISVHFNDNECIIDLAYRLVNPKETVIKIVSRVNMTHRTAESFLKVFSNALLDYKNKKKPDSSPNQQN